MPAAVILSGEGRMRMLGDCHIHMVLDGVYYKDAIAAHKVRTRDDIIRPRLAEYAARGIRFLRDGGDAFGAGERARALAPEYGIDYRSPVFPICLKGRYGAFIGRTFETMTDFLALLDEIGRRRGDFIKLMISGLMDFEHYGVVTSWPLEKGMLGEMIRAAHGEGYAVMVHANGARTILDALELGVDSVEHGAYMTEEAVRAMAQADAVWVPTLSTVGNLIGEGRYPDAVLTRILESQLKNVAACARLGGRVALGSDAGAYCVPHVKGTFDEYMWLRQAMGDETGRILFEGEAFIRDRFDRKC